MTLAAGVLQGAGGRLLPPSIPFRFFGLAVLSHVAFWAMLCVDAEQLAGFRGGLAPVLAAIHLLTIGVLVTTAIGAAVQILPVVTRRTLAAVWPVRFVFWLLLPGLVLLVAGFQVIRPGLASAGGILAGTAICAFAAILADNLRRTSRPPVVLAFCWTALAALVATALLGVTVVVNFQWGGLSDHVALAHAHLILGGFGGMGLFVLGFSHVLVPMFTLASVPEARWAWTGFATAVLAVALGMAGALAHSTLLLTAAGGTGLAACGVHLWLMRQALRGGMRRRLGLSFVLLRSAWVLLPVALGAGLAVVLGGEAAGGPVPFALLLFVGWLLTFLLGILQRILPMLASMHVAAGARTNPLLAAEGVQGYALGVHAACHALALAGVLAGVVADVVPLVQAGSAIGFVGAVAFAVFSGDVMRRSALRRAVEVSARAR